MKRWHEERALMFRRWKMEMEKHGYDWRNPPRPSCAPSKQGVRGVCHCAAGIGSMRKRRPYDCGKARCGLCHWEKFYDLKDRYNKRREAISWELSL